jgi:hypothetical protein
MLFQEFIVSELGNNMFRSSIEFDKTVIYRRDKERSEIRRKRVVKEN